MLTQINCLITANKREFTPEPDINTLDKDGNNLLHFLLMNFDKDVEENREKVIELINAGIETNHYNRDAFTPLHLAFKNRQIHAIRFCVEVNLNSISEDNEPIFDFKLRSKHNYSCLHIACLYGFNKFLDFYINNDKEFEGLV